MSDANCGYLTLSVYCKLRLVCLCEPGTIYMIVFYKDKIGRLLLYLILARVIIKSFLDPATGTHHTPKTGIHHEKGNKNYRE